MSSFRLRPPVAGDAAAVADVVRSTEDRLYGHASFSESDVQELWRGFDLEHRALVAVEADEAVVGYGFASERGALWRVQATVRPDACGRGIGTAFAAAFEELATRGGAARVQSSVYERDLAAQRLLDRRGYDAVRVFREMRIELDAPPAPPVWPEGVRPEAFDADRDARAFHAAETEAFADHWEHHVRSFDEWRAWHLDRASFDPSLWCVVRAGDEIAAGAISVGGLFGGGWISVVFTRRPWRGRGVGRALLQDAFARFWERGERSIGLGVDAQSDTGAFRLYERAGMTPVLGWVMYEKALRAE